MPELSKDTDRVWEMMSDLDYCMLTTHDGASMHARPMSSIVKKDEGRIYFLTQRDAAAVAQIAGNADVLLAYSNGKSQFLEVKAKAHVTDDRALIKRLWNPGAQAFWPEGPEDQNVVALVTDPRQAQFWDSPSGIISAAKFMVALATGNRPDLGESGTVTL